jgi:hypothetical protein
MALILLTYSTNPRIKFKTQTPRMDQIHNTLVFNGMGSINSICKGNIKKTMEKLLGPIMRLQKDAH